MEQEPLILTLSINKEAFDFFTHLRTQHFPPHRNYLQAHLTLFHHLPDEKDVVDALAAITQTQGSFSMQVTELMSLGNGVAYRIASQSLQQIHKDLQQQWQHFLTPQDKQKLRAHITIQNKVNAVAAKSLLENLKEGFRPFEITSTGFTLWRYKGGPWELFQELPFQI